MIDACRNHETRWSFRDALIAMSWERMILLAMLVAHEHALCGDCTSGLREALRREDT